MKRQRQKEGARRRRRKRTWNLPSRYGGGAVQSGSGPWRRDATQDATGAVARVETRVLQSLPVWDSLGSVGRK